MSDLISKEIARRIIASPRNKEQMLRMLESIPPAKPELIKCDYVKACNEVTMNETFSALRYLSMLDKFEVYGYILVKRRTE